MSKERITSNMELGNKAKDRVTGTFEKLEWVI